MKISKPRFALAYLLAVLVIPVRVALALCKPEKRAHYSSSLCRVRELPAKGQLISKRLFAILEFFQKMDETIRS